ncbi:MAG: bifunctional hydroxymethylpyrimidine kinase/phosphomethylpyrimidine kinase, partial [Thermoplasmata archaeon]|nr:bifunctional hydroxymethylpyrimidine kinase/phosphomethylpyrimidine kinase [Thermoplasmata archaeon]
MALTVAGSDSSGGAGIQADLKAFAVVGVHGASVVTAVTAQNSRGVRGLYPLAVSDIEAQIDAVAQDMGPRWAKTGLLYDPRTVRGVAGRLAHHNIDVVVDPVITAGSGDALSERGLLDAIVADLLPRASLITPNVMEASEILRGRRIATSKEMKMAAEDIRQMGAGAVLLKGGHLEGTLDVVDVLCKGQGVFEEFRHSRLPGSFHGTGCTLSALITGYLAWGEPLDKAVARAERVQHTMMVSAYSVGEGDLYLDHMAPVKMAALRWEVARQVRLGARQLELMLTDDWLPEIGTNIVFALPQATVADEVAALTGRIHRVCKHAQALG